MNEINEKQKRFAINFIIYIFVFSIVCFVGVFTVSADTIDTYSTKYYYYFANDNSSINSTPYRSGESNKVTLDGATAPTYANGEGFNGFYNQISYSITKGSIYTLSLTVSYNGLLDNEFSRETINNRLFNTSFAHCSNCTVTAVSGSIRRFNSTNQGVSNLYDFDVRVNYTILATSNASTWYLGSYTGDDRTLGVDNHQYTSIVTVHTLNISNDNNSTIINQNQTIIDQNNQIINGNKQNTQDIINNNNENIDKLIENEKSCIVLNSNKVIQWGAYLKDNGNVIIGSSSSIGISDYINISGATIDFDGSKSQGFPSTCFYKKDKSLIRCHQNRFFTDNVIPDNSFYMRYSYMRTYNSPIINLCKNGNQALNDSVNDLNDTLKDTNVDTSSLNNVVGWLPPGPVDGIINLPLNLFNAYANALGLQCSPLNIPLPYVNKNLPIPCIRSLLEQIGITDFWDNIGLLIAAIMLYYYLLNLYHWVDETLSLRENTLPGYYDDNFGGGA